MADDVELQSEGNRTLHLKELRVQWQVIALQTIATLALIWLFLQLGSNFGSCDPSHVDGDGNTLWCPALDHTLSLDLFETILGSESGDSAYDCLLLISLPAKVMRDLVDITSPSSYVVC